MNGTSFRSELSIWLKQGNMVNYLLAANVIVFLVLGVLYILVHLAPATATAYGLVFENMSLHSHLSVFIRKPWGLLSYMFVHQNLLHIFFNMLMFYWFGNLFRSELGNHRVLPLYLLAGIAGGFFYIMIYQILPGMAALDFQLIGASGAVLAFAVASAAVLPNLQFNLFIFGNVKLKWIATIMVVIDIAMFPFSGNKGGLAAHLGGAAFGLLYVASLRNGLDLAKPLIWLFAKIAPSPGVSITTKRKKSFTPKKSPLKVVKGKGEENIQGRLDQLLDKINEKGMNSLSSEEKKWLEKYSKD
ncbi:membrane associated rhomboid family serine protease [Chitinophaga skermanii]|uniref:Membrane associated rhomboid family serine protease n=1 Tax=Chitinophaga skermanii TaxID=331697 RepID=A0A327Q6M7_9BACT|nr:rhomboid family intramembrane serine protease [Chitinophaga skermanii]RAI99457.1 membrane associated rhomboid family serine protease [Chitinophaga skermanii]